MRLGGRRTALAILSLAVTACGPASGATSSGNARPMSIEDCRAPSQLGGYAKRGVATGDVDGDSADDAVVVLAHFAAPPGCRFFLAAELASGGFAVRRLPDPIVDASPATARGVPWPRLTLLAPIDRRPGVEVVLTVEQGAATGFLGVYGVRGGRFARFTLDVKSMTNQFSWGLGNRPSTVDCTGRDRGHVVQSSARHEALAWVVRRRFFQADDFVFRYRASDSERFRVTDLQQLPEFRRSAVLGDRYPFQTCGAILAKPA